LRFRTRTAVALGAVGCAAALLAVVACIPDLPDDPGQDGGAEAGPDQIAPPVSRCGDGVVDLSRQEQCDPGGAAGDAGANGCSPDCKMLCPDGSVWPSNNHCYQPVAGGAANLDQGTDLATTRCALLGGHVVTFAGEEEYTFVSGLLDGGAFWVGLNSAFFKYNGLATFEPGWSTTCSGCFAHTADAAVALPTDDAGPQGCVEGFADTSRSWQQYPCTGNDPKRIGLVCEREPGPFPQSVRCDAGICIDLVWTFGTKRYVYVRTAATGDVADQACRAMGGSLVVLQSRDEREQLWKELSRMPGFSTPPGAVWMGLSVVGADDAGDPVWAWADDAAVVDDAHASPWGDRQPKTGTRAYLYHSSQPPTPVDDTLARTAAATTAFPYVCQLPP
jgi:hypothetical protein